MMKDDSWPFVRRISDIIQGFAVMTIAGLVVVVLDLRVTVASRGEVITAQEMARQKEVESLRELFDERWERYAIQLDQLSRTQANNQEALASMIDRLTVGGFNAEQGRALSDRVTDNARTIERHEGLWAHPGAAERHASSVVQTENLETTVAGVSHRIERLESMMPSYYNDRGDPR